MSDEVKKEVENGESFEDKNILTQNELDKKAGEKSPAVDSESDQGVSKDKPKSKKKKKKKKKPESDTFECGIAPAGEANIAFVHTYKDKEYLYQLKLNDRKYKLPGNLDAEERPRYRTALKANGFEDVTVLDGTVEFTKETGKFIYKLMHPEHTDRNPINGTIGLVLVGEDGKKILDKDGKVKTVQMTIVDGLAITEDKLVYQALLEAGFYGQGRPK